MDFTSVDNLMEYLKGELEDVIANEVVDEVKEVIAEEIDYMYTEYTPLSYVRRMENGGFADKDNLIVSNYDETKTGFMFSIENITEGVGYNKGQLLAPFIEEGIYNTLIHPPPRPVMERSKERINDEQVIEMSLRKGFRNKGIELE